MEGSAHLRPVGESIAADRLVEIEESKDGVELDDASRALARAAATYVYCEKMALLVESLAAEAHVDLADATGVDPDLASAAAKLAKLATGLREAVEEFRRPVSESLALRLFAGAVGTALGKEADA